ncbi:hypothetical protein DFQ26_008399 [Actinomortierella ambigua]|nr:hypothetical protein DFQ26_008399 [Actinomortierella ambigua]
MVPLHDQVELAKMTTTPDDSDVAGSCTKLGLEQLKNLKCLEVLDLSDREYVQGIREFRWMKANWTSLAKLVVDRIKSEQKRAWLRTWWPELNVVEIGR